MQKVHVRRSLQAVACAAVLAALGTGCSEIQEPVADEVLPLAAVGEFSKPRSVPTRGRIVFSAELTGDPEIYSVLENGTGLVRLTYSPGIDRYPTWSPDGRKIAFVSHRADGAQIYSMNADGSGVKRLTSFPVGHIQHLRWSPDGRRIAFARTEATLDEESDLYTMSSNGRSVVRLTNRPGNDEHPTWSPDGTMLLFQTGAGQQFGDGRIHRMNADGTGEVVVLECAAGCFQPAWSPDGTQFLFRSEGALHAYHFAHGFSIHVRDHAARGIYSPDGVKIAYVDIEIAANSSMFTINAMGGEPTQVTTYRPEDQLDWGR